MGKTSFAKLTEVCATGCAADAGPVGCEADWAPQADRNPAIKMNAAIFAYSDFIINLLLKAI